MSNKKDIVQLIKSLFQRKILSKKRTEKKVQKDSFLSTDLLTEIL